MNTATKSRTDTPVRKTTRTKATKEETFPKMTPWGKEVLKRIEALHKAMDGKKLA